MRQSTHKLHAALRKAGLDELAERAKAEEFHDYFSPHAAPLMKLHEELQAVGTPAAQALMARVVNGDFDATSEESDEWAASPEGQEAFASLVGQGKATRDAGSRTETLKFRPLEDRVLRLVWEAHERSGQDAVQTFSDLMTAAAHAGAILNVEPDTAAVAMTTVLETCLAAQAQRPDIFGDDAERAARRHDA